MEHKDGILNYAEEQIAICGGSDRACEIVNNFLDREKEEVIKEQLLSNIQKRQDFIHTLEFEMILVKEVMEKNLNRLAFEIKNLKLSNTKDQIEINNLYG